MNYSHEDENYPLTRFESMLKTNDILFFDSNEFENIIHHYLENGKIALAKRAIKLGLEQHPTSINLRLFQVTKRRKFALSLGQDKKEFLFLQKLLKVMFPAQLLILF